VITKHPLLSRNTHRQAADKPYLFQLLTFNGQLLAGVRPAAVGAIIDGVVAGLGCGASDWIA